MEGSVLVLDIANFVRLDKIPHSFRSNRKFTCASSIFGCHLIPCHNTSLCTLLAVIRVGLSRPGTWGREKRENNERDRAPLARSFVIIQKFVPF
jgi:hypothetical protein